MSNPRQDSFAALATTIAESLATPLRASLAHLPQLTAAQPTPEQDATTIPDLVVPSPVPQLAL
ncbi:hypothetical protein BGZ73_004057, partial [Actinomortierella ambigua]